MDTTITTDATEPCSHLLAPEWCPLQPPHKPYPPLYDPVPPTKCHLSYSKEYPSQQTSPTPTGKKPVGSYRPLTASRSEGDITITHAPCFTTRPPITLPDRLAAAKETGDALHQPSKSAPHNPLNKYTKGNMPKVHVTDPTSTLNYIDISLIVKWENYDNGKLLAIPFGNEAENVENHNHIGERLLTAAAEITQSDNIGISTPTPSDEANLSGNTPISFLIYNLTANEIDVLMERGVWSSRAITFQVTELHPPRLDFLFTIKGFKTCNDTSILRMIQSVWQSKDAQNIIDDIVESFAEECRPEIRNSIQTFLNSAYLKRLNFKTRGKCRCPML